MVKVTFLRSFKFSPDGSQVVEYKKGPAEVSDRCAKVADQAGVIEKPKAESPKETKKTKENKKKA